MKSLLFIFKLLNNCKSLICIINLIYTKLENCCSWGCKIKTKTYWSCLLWLSIVVSWFFWAEFEYPAKNWQNWLAEKIKNNTKKIFVKLIIESFKDVVDFLHQCCIISPNALVRVNEWCKKTNTTIWIILHISNKKV